MEVKILVTKDINRIADLQPIGWQDIIPIFEYYTNAEFCFPFKVTIHKKIVGIGATIVHKGTAWLAHIIVHHDHRNKGIGNLITQTLVARAQSKSCNTIYLLATDLGAPVYKRIGFVTETEYLFFKDVYANKNWTTCKNIIPYDSSFRSQMIQLDLKVSGEERFFQFEPHLSNACYYLQKNHLEGFYLPTFREGLIIANTAKAGFELMKFRLIEKENAIFPVDNLNAIAFMEQLNYKPYRIEKRMRLGVKRSWQPENIYNRIGGNLG